MQLLNESKAVEIHDHKLKALMMMIWCFVFVVAAGCEWTKQEASLSPRQKKQNSDQSGLQQTTPKINNTPTEINNTPSDRESPRLNATTEFSFEGLYREFITIQDQFDYPEEQEFLPVKDGKSPPPVDLSTLTQSIANRDTKIELPKEFAEVLRVGGMRRGGISPFVFCSTKQANAVYLNKLKSHDFFTKHREPTVFTQNPYNKMVKTDGHWRNGWIPFAANEGSLLFIDLDPDSEGQFAQVVMFDHDEFTLTVLAPNLEKFFRSLPDRIDTGITDWPYLRF